MTRQRGTTKIHLNHGCSLLAEGSDRGCTPYFMRVSRNPLATATSREGSTKLLGLGALTNSFQGGGKQIR